MVKVRFIAVLSLVIAILFTGCGYDKIVADSPLSEEEIISYVQQKIRTETGDNVTAEILSKKQLEVATAWLDGPMGYQKVTGGHEYELKITNNDDKNVTATGTYKDGYIVYDKKSQKNGVRHESTFYSDYSGKKGTNNVKNEFIQALDEEFDEYYIYEDVGTPKGLDIFICSTDYELINSLLQSFKNTALKFRSQQYVTYSVYIYKDEKAFKNTDFDRYKDCKVSYGGQSNALDIIGQYTGKQAVRLSYCRSFDRSYFESNGTSNAKKTIDDTDPNSFEYVIFWYDAEPNSFRGNNTPDLYVFGVR